MSQVRTFVAQQGPSIHPALAATPDPFDDQRAVPKVAIDDAEHSSQDFCSALTSLRDSTTDGKTVLKGFDINAFHTWDEVMQCAKFAVERYHEEAKGPAGACRRTFRLVGDNAKALNPFVAFIPNDKYMSILCGGLKFLLNAAAFRSDRRNQILDTFDEVPDTIIWIQRFRQLYPDDSNLRDGAIGVYIVTLKMMKAMVKCLDKSLRKKLAETIKGPLADKDIDENIKGYKRQLEKIREHVGLLGHRAYAQMSANMEGLTTVTVNGFAQTRNDMTSGVEQLHSMMKQLGFVADTNFNKLQSQCDATANLAYMLLQTLNNANWSRQQEEADNARQAKPRPLPPYAVADSAGLLRLLNVPSHAASAELDLVLSRANDLDAASQAQAAWLLQHRRFRQWLSSRDPDLLLVDGHADAHACGRMSPMSLVCGLLARMLEHYGRCAQPHGQPPPPQPIVLSFFCGLHQGGSRGGGGGGADALPGPVGLMRSLIAQLLAHYPFDVSFIAARAWRQPLERHELEPLTVLVAELVRQLPEVPLFCVIDGIDCYEGAGWDDGKSVDVGPGPSAGSARGAAIRLVVERLLAIVGDARTNAVVKVLATSAGASRHVKPVVPLGQRLWIPRDMPSDEHEAGDGHLWHAAAIALAPPVPAAAASPFAAHAAFDEPGAMAGQGFGSAMHLDYDDIFAGGYTF